MKTGKRHRPNSNSDIEGPPPPSVENRNVSKQIIAEMSQYLDKLSTINQSDRFHLEIELRLGIHMGKSFRSGVRMYTLYYSSNTPSRSQKNFLMNGYRKAFPFGAFRWHKSNIGNFICSLKCITMRKNCQPEAQPSVNMHDLCLAEHG